MHDMKHEDIAVVLARIEERQVANQKTLYEALTRQEVWRVEHEAASKVRDARLTALEHSKFWIMGACFGVALIARAVWEWITGPHK